MKKARASKKTTYSHNKLKVGQPAGCFHNRYKPHIFNNTTYAIHLELTDYSLNELLNSQFPYRLQAILNKTTT